MRIPKNFWLYFYSTPYALGGFLLFFIGLIFPHIANNSLQNAAKICGHVSDKAWVCDDISIRDKCIIDEMKTIEMVEILILDLSLVGLLFMIPLSVYLVLSRKKYNFGFRKITTAIIVGNGVMLMGLFWGVLILFDKSDWWGLTSMWCGW